MAEETATVPATAVTDAEAKPAAAKKEKPPALESKPFADFINGDFLPTLTKELQAAGLADISLELSRLPVDVLGYEGLAPCDRVVGKWADRRFDIYFFDGDIQGRRGFSHTERNVRPGTMEPFLIDEKKITLDLLVFAVLRRLNAQKWLKAWN
jgi:hypothetical protein